ncbi:MAG TPA: hypothetical protein VMD77_14205 [Candidatus Baltobacteraceae bacterium]|nr:hypothetical protein [Candidatus Baltobacteraceae bacterium]
MDYGPHSGVRKATSRDPEPDPNELIPFGRTGAGLLTSHPVGLVVVFGLLFMGLMWMPEARWFFAGAVPFGAAWGLVLWLRHR